jgi:glycosyltransferase involved in cell wall biosynthesis
LPVITTAIGAIGEAARDGVTALMVPPQNTDALVAALLRLRDDAALRARLGQAGLTEARARFSEGAMLDRMEAIFLSAVRDKEVLSGASAT